MLCCASDYSESIDPFQKDSVDNSSHDIELRRNASESADGDSMFELWKSTTGFRYFTDVSRLRLSENGGDPESLFDSSNSFLRMPHGSKAFSGVSRSLK